MTDLLESERPVDVIAGALLIAAREYPDLDLHREKERIVEIGVEATRRVAAIESPDNPFARLEALNTYMFEDLGFHGNDEDFEDPRNSFLNQVLDRRTGIPITLSILFMEVARAAGFTAEGIALPGHFITRLDYQGRTLLVDPFNRGQILTEEDCVKLVKRTTGRPSLFQKSLLDGASSEVILARLLHNLKRIYLSREDYKRALAMVETLLWLAPDESREIRDRGILQSHLGNASEAITDLEEYLASSPDAPDAESVMGRLTWLKQKTSESPRR
jgi:regulator of sirC expression with transglutaminase-like and TPR domain